jgi:glycogen phosphorylase
MNFRTILVHPEFPESLTKLYTLAGNLWCTWSYDALNLFYRIDAELFRKVQHNPVKFLHSLPKYKVESMSRDRGLLFELDEVWDKFQEYMHYTGRFEEMAAGGVTLKPDDVVAYFSMEYGLHEAIPIYAGGLGVLSGDTLKGASDLGLPVVGVGLVYKCGYFTQMINADGQQTEVCMEFENHLVPMQEIRLANGQNAIISVQMGGKLVKAKLWQIMVGKIQLVLLDTDIEENDSDSRAITGELYISDREKRLQQEILLGLGGIEALDLLGIQPKIYHLNEGHSAFLVVARLKKLMKDKGLTLSQARAVIRASTVFTTHTPVAAGNENFSTDIVRRYVEPHVRPLGISFEQFAAAGFIDDKRETFWMPALAIRYAKYVNAVSKQHGEVSRRLWRRIFPERPTVEIPVDYVTNGVHRYWVSQTFTNMFNRYIGPDYIHKGHRPEIWEKIFTIPDEEMWEAHRRNKQDLVNFVRNKLAADIEAKGYSAAKVFQLSRQLNPEYLTVVFSRRFASYKRPTLILKDKERLKKLLSDPRKPVQLIFAGKAHPADVGSKMMIKEIVAFAKQSGLEDRIIFLENYDMNVARHLVWGADVWLNNPVKEMEASGTSGMKAAMNGILQLSTPEGWWPEAYNGRNGWTISAGGEYGSADLHEMAEATQIYELLEDEITEFFYDRNDSGLPVRWVRMMKESIFSVCSQFNMDRVLSSYVQKFYVPAVASSAEVVADDFKAAKAVSQEEAELLGAWEGIRIVEFSTDADKSEHIVEGQEVGVRCAVVLGQARNESVTVELFYMHSEGREYDVLPMKFDGFQDGKACYSTKFTIKGYGIQSFNVRIRPANPLVAECNPEMIKWKD